jgi:hypothetical protein
MTVDQEERLVVALEKIAAAFAGIDDTRKKQFAKQWPEPKEFREAVYSRVPTEEDRLREEHGVTDEPLKEWLTVPEEELLGPREREFLRRQNAGTEAAANQKSGSSSFDAPESKT